MGEATVVDDTAAHPGVVMPGTGGTRECALEGLQPQHVADRARPHRGPQRPVTGVVMLVGVHGQDEPPLGRGGDEIISFLGGQAERLLDHDVLPGLQRPHGPLGVGMRRRGDDDEAHVMITHQLGWIGDPAGTAIAATSRRAGSPVADRGHLQAFGRLDGQVMDGGGVGRTEQPHPYRRRVKDPQGMAQPPADQSVVGRISQRAVARADREHAEACRRAPGAHRMVRELVANHQQLLHVIGDLVGNDPLVDRAEGADPCGELTAVRPRDQPELVDRRHSPGQQPQRLDQRAVRRQ